MTSTATLARNIVLIACAVSAGVHAGLVPEHLAEEERMGLAFVATTALLLVLSVLLARARDPRRLAALAAASMAGLIVAYALSRTVGLPLLGEDAEALDAVGLVTQAVQAGGLIAALYLCQAARDRTAPALRKDVP